MVALFTITTAIIVTIKPYHHVRDGLP